MKQSENIKITLALIILYILCAISNIGLGLILYGLFSLTIKGFFKSSIKTTLVLGSIFLIAFGACTLMISHL